MSQPETLTLASIWALFNLRSLYTVGYAWLLGMSIWVTFFAGPIAYRALPRHQFGALQHRVFPIYFVQSIVASAVLLVLWVRAHPAVSAHLSPAVADVAQTYTLSSVLVMQSANHFVAGPLTSKIMFDRHKLEKAEGKSYNEEGVSDAMKALNSKFSTLHGVSSLLNLFAVIALLFHGLWISNAGTGL
ncbi:uncharacterized protein C8Q71DRAFT_799890 [Rhodofomes roseus]|uniref:TMEM205-like domain-containing protein n=1 Tax=Rhodofomes roseus TaxID=34475 RepID=A0ABQ8JXY0_9APHY|nr:uncharacterized protein C8Q71DRAFT_799890 [Rhodofomes roseus]KAH9828966.1 hypothetical protein C8Q71DRAFT_799890 [Rhodofomes roseus]